MTGIEGIQPFNSGGSPFREVALALLDAEQETNQAAAIRTAFLDRRVNPQFLIDLVSVTVGVLAFRADETPRSIYETLFEACPSDDDWRDNLEAWIASHKTESED